MRPSRLAVTGIVLVLAAFLLTACSGSGNSGTTAAGKISLSALVLPDNVSVVDPKGGSVSTKPSLFKSIISALTLTGLPPASDYANDKVSVYVNERSLDSLRSVSEILCMVRQSRYDAMLNQGPYIAQVDKNLCSSARSDASSAGQASTNQSSGATMPMYENWTVNSSRSSSQSPHIVQIWVHSQDNNSSKVQYIYAKVVITQGADTAPPYGVFKMNFKFYDPADLTTIMARGFLNAERDASGKVLLYFATEDKDSYEIQKATLDKDIVNNKGAGSVLKAETGPWLPSPQITRFNLAYDAGNFLRTDSTGTICLDRDNIVESSWRYGLYTTATNPDPTVPLGTRVTRNSNFQVKKGGVYGSIGYWGAWFPPVNGIPVTVNDGDLVYKHDYSNNTDTAYTVFQRGGKLKKYSRNNVTLNEIKNIPLVWFEGNNVFGVVWTGSDLYKISQLQGGNTWTTLPTPVLLDLTQLPWVDIMFWSQSLSGSVIVKLPPPTSVIPNPLECTKNGNNTFNCTNKATNATQVVYFQEQLIFPGDTVPAKLACFDRCPDTAALATANPFRTDIQSYQLASPLFATYASYSFNSTTMLLTNSATGAPVTAGTNTFYQNGITSGVLFDPSNANLTSLACDWDATLTCGGKAGTSLSEFFVWETGPNSWNQFVTVKDAAGVPIKFDPPLQVMYKHKAPISNPTLADIKYDNITFFLEYSGFGDLHGIPGMCVNIDTGAQNIDCSLGGNAVRWVPEFSIPRTDAASNLTEVTDIAQPSITYFVKALETEQRLGAGGTCTGLTTTPFQLPSMSSWIDPIIGAEPVITAPPAVIGGVVQ